MIQSLHIIGSLQMGGAEHFFMRLVKALNQYGHRAVPVVRPDSPLTRESRELLPEPLTIPMRNGWDFFSVLAIRRLIQETGAPIIQTYMGRASRLTHLPRRCNAVHIARLGGYYKIRGYYHHAHAWIGNTHGLCDYMIEQGLSAKRIFTIGNFVEIQPSPPSQAIWQLRNTLNIPDDAVIIFSLGRFIDIKGFDDLLTAFALLPPAIQERPLYLVIAGDGPLRRQLHAQAAELNLTHRIRWVGWLNNPSPYFHLADIFVCPSRHETLGNVILEAWAHHRPVISTRTPGAMELIRKEENGLLAPCGQPQALANRLQEMIQMAETARCAIADNGFLTVKRHHSKDAVVTAYMNLYEQLRPKEI